MMHTIRQFSGKSNDSMEYVAKAVIEQIGISLYGANSLTLRPFFRKYDKNSKTQLLTPAVSLSRGIGNLADCLGLINFSYKEYSDHDLLMDHLKSYQPDKYPIILGPLSKKTMWNRVDSLFYDNKSYFITLIGNEEDGFYIHDPEGTPYLRLDTEELRKNITALSLNKLLIPLSELKGTSNIEAEIWPVFIQKLKKLCQDAAKDEFTGSKGMILLHNDIGDSNRSSFKTRLYYNFIDIQNANQTIKEFFFNPIETIRDHIKNQISDSIDEYNQVIGKLLVAVINDDIISIKNHLLTCVELEKKLLEIYSEI